MMQKFIEIKTLYTMCYFLFKNYLTLHNENWILMLCFLEWYFISLNENPKSKHNIFSKFYE
jgi:hypothetical protein